MNQKQSWIMVVVVLVVWTILLGVFFTNMSTGWNEKDEFCELNGYQEASSYSIKTIDGKEYIQCYKNEIRFGKLIEIEDWLVFKGEI